MLSAFKKSGGRVYYFTRCRTCISIRKTVTDPQYRCVWCDPSQTKGKSKQVKVERRAMLIFIPAFLLLIAGICFAIVHY